MSLRIAFFLGGFSDDAVKLLAVITEAIAPPLWQSEFRNVLVLYLRKKLISMEEALRIYALAEQRLTIVPFEPPALAVLDLAGKSRCSAYDCEFIALAQTLGTLLVTQDKKILREFSDTAIPIADALKRV